MKPPKVNSTTFVWHGAKFLGKINILPKDWHGVNNWRQAAMKAARRNYGNYNFYVDFIAPFH